VAAVDLEADVAAVDLVVGACCKLVAAVDLEDNLGLGRVGSYRTALKLYRT
jgi:hypothetical protein